MSGLDGPPNTRVPARVVVIGDQTFLNVFGHKFAVPSVEPQPRRIVSINLTVIVLALWLLRELVL